jgi:hypothetical protein
MIHTWSRLLEGIAAGRRGAYQRGGGEHPGDVAEVVDYLRLGIGIPVQQVAGCKAKGVMSASSPDDGRVCNAENEAGNGTGCTVKTTNLYPEQATA